MRQLNGSWIDEYIRFIEPVSESPRRYHFWCAATAIAASLKRHIFYVRGESRVYPNTYTVLVGRPGVGKGQAIIPIVALLSKANSANILSDRLTMPYILEALSKGFPSQISNQKGGIQIGTDASAIIVADEMSVFVGKGDDVLDNLCALWDSREHPFGYGTRGKGQFNIDKPSVSLLAATSPTWLSRSVPVSSIGGGFTRRVNFIFSKEARKDKPYMSVNGSSIRDALVNDLRYIGSNLTGEYKLAEDAKPFFEAYYKSCLVGDLEDEATGVYKDSKWVHALKLGMVLTASEGDSKEISLRNLKRAAEEIDLVTEDIKTVFRGVGANDLAVAANKVIEYLEIKGFATGKELQASLWQYAMADQMAVILQTLKQAGLIVEYTQGKELVYKAI